MKSKKELKQASAIENANIFAWYSTYGQLTVERLFERYSLNIEKSILKIALNNQRSFYFQLLRIPYNNILNTLILDQAYEYQTFAQKIFVDFLLSGQGDLPEGTPGEQTRDAVDDKRIALVGTIEKFSHEQNSQRRFIAQSQAKLIKITKSFNQEMNALVNDKLFHSEGINSERAKYILNVLLAHQDDNETILEDAFKKITDLTTISITDKFQSQLTTLVTPLLKYADELPLNMGMELEQANYFNNMFREFRNEFYNIILTTNELIRTLPDYRKLQEKETKNLELLNFDNIE